MVNGILAYIGIGSNLSDPLQQCRTAIGELSRRPGITLERLSSFYKTEPVLSTAGEEEHSAELDNQNWFVNAVAEIRTTFSAHDLLEALQDIERKMGRVRSFAGAPRIIDLDLLLYGQEMVNENGLIVPHPEMHKRLFVLEPLCEIASYLVHPVFGVSMRGLKDRLDDQKIVQRYDEEKRRLP